jgi:hypothetical protein
MADGASLVEAARALQADLAAALFADAEVAAEPWQGIADQHQALAAASGAPLEPEAEAAGLMAEVVGASALEDARSLARGIPDRPECAFYALAADVVVRDRAVRADPGPARPHAELAESLYTLLRGYYGTVGNYIAGSLRVLSEYAAFLVRADDATDTLSEAAALTAGVSQLAGRHGVYRYVESAVTLGERSLRENRGATGRAALGVWTIANNLANLHIALARDDPAVGAAEYRAALRCAEAALAAADAATGEDVHEYREMTQRRQEWLRTMLEPVDPMHDSHAAALTVEYLLAAERVEDWPQRAASRITAAGASGERARLADELLAAEYEELAAELESAVAACGFDWSVGKLCLALGAVASGRLGELTGELVRHWLTSAAMPQDTRPWTAYRARQYVSASGESPPERAGAVGRIIGLAMVADAVESADPDVGFRVMLRARNADLFRRLVRGMPVFQELAGPVVSQAADLDALRELGRQVFRPPAAAPPGGPTRG